MPRLLTALLACALFTIPAHASPRKAQDCVSDNNGRVVCWQASQRMGGLPRGSGIVAHPAGCPRRAFCGCGVSVAVFGKPIRSLYLARNWLRFPRTSPAPGMVAYHGRRGGGHVMLIKSVNGDGTALVYDPNSGGGKTRVHVRSIAGLRIVNPHATQVASQ